MGIIRVARDLALINVIAEREMNAVLVRDDFNDLASHIAALEASLREEIAR